MSTARTRGDLWVSWGLFVGLFLVLHALLALAQKPAWKALDAWTATATAASLRLLGTKAYADGVIVHSSLFTLRIIRGCTGIHQVMMYVAAVTAFPARWRPKIAGIGLGVPALLLLTQIRLVSLCYVGRFFPAQFEFAHMVLWQSLMVMITGILWLLWASLAT